MQLGVCHNCDHRDYLFYAPRNSVGYCMACTPYTFVCTKPRFITNPGGLDRQCHVVAQHARTLDAQANLVVDRHNNPEPLGHLWGHDSETDEDCSAYYADIALQLAGNIWPQLEYGRLDDFQTIIHAVGVFYRYRYSDEDD